MEGIKFSDFTLSKAENGTLIVGYKGNDNVRLDLTELLASKVDKEEGKGLSTNDFTSTLKEKLEALIQDKPIDLTEITALLSKKVDKVEGKGLSKNDFTDALKKKLDSLVTPPNPNVAMNGDFDMGDLGWQGTETPLKVVWKEEHYHVEFESSKADKGLVTLYKPYLLKNRDYTLSAYIRLDPTSTEDTANLTLNFQGAGIGQGEVREITKEWVKYTMTQAYKASPYHDIKFFGVGKFNVKLVKMEQGTEATPFVKSQYDSRLLSFYVDKSKALSVPPTE